MSLQLIPAILCVWIGGDSVFPSDAFVNSESAEDPLASAFQAWEDYRNLVRRLQGISRHRKHYSSPADSLKEDSYEWEFRQAHMRTRVITRQFGVPDLPAEKAVVVNSRYAFEVERPTRQRMWVLTRLDTHLNDRKGIDPQARQRVMEESCLVLISLKGRLLPDLFRGNNCMILETRHVERNKSSFVQVTFRDTTSVPEEQGGWRYLEGTVLLDPEHLYVVKEARLSGRILGDLSCDVVIEHEYRKENTGCVIPVKRTTSVTYRNGAFTRSETTDSEFSWEERSDIPESDFTLSAFGLPEPPGVAWERPTPWWLYGIVVGFALVILSGIVYKVVGRWRTQAAKPQPR